MAVQFQTEPKFGLWVTLTEWYVCTTFRVNSSQLIFQDGRRAAMFEVRSGRKIVEM
jgi:hypothetical protein